MNSFNNLISNILSESPVGTRSKREWVASLISKLCLNREDTPEGIKQKYANEFQDLPVHKDALNTDRYLYDDFANVLGAKVRKAALTLASSKNSVIDKNFIRDNADEIVNMSGYNTDDIIGSNIKSDLMASANGHRELVPIAKSTFIALVVKLIGERAFDKIFASEERDIKDYHERPGMSGAFPLVSVADTDTEWDSLVLFGVKSAFQQIASELKLPYASTPISPKAYNPNTKVKENQRLVYTARITAQASESIAFNFPMQRTGMGRGSGGDKRASEEIMTASANKRELVANAQAAIDDAEQFSKYKYKFTEKHTGLSEYETDVLDNVIASLPSEASKTYSSETLIQACKRSGVFSVPRKVREFIHKLITLDIVEPIPVVRSSGAGIVDDIDLF